MKRDNFFAQWSELHGGATVSGVVRGWLTISYALVKPLALMRISPSAISLLGLLFGVLTWIQSETIFGLIFLALSLIADGIDGSLAIIRERVSTWGGHLDSVIDRVVEFFWALTFVRIGAPVIVVGIAWCAALTQEYVRARAAGLGYRSIEVITVCERPVRAILLAFAMIAHLSHLRGLNEVAWIWMALQVGSLVVVLRDAYAALRTNN